VLISAKTPQKLEVFLVIAKLTVGRRSISPPFELSAQPIPVIRRSRVDLASPGMRKMECSSSYFGQANGGDMENNSGREPCNGNDLTPCGLASRKDENGILRWRWIAACVGRAKRCLQVDHVGVV
jgi:hypothetical protein